MAGHHQLKSGTPILMMRMAQQLTQRGHHVTMLFNGNSSDVEQLKSSGSAVHVIASDRMRFNKEIVISILTLRKFLKEKQFDLVHAHDSQALDHLLMASVGLNVPIVVSRGFMKPLRRWNAYKYRLRRVRRIFVVSNAVKKRMQMSGGFSLDHKFVIYRGVLEAKKFQGHSLLREELSLCQETTLVGIITNESFLKGADLLITAHANMIAQGATHHLVLAGVSKEFVYRYVQDEAVLKTIHALGFRRDIENILTALDLFVFTSRGEEALGLTIAEAQMAGVPVIVMNSGGSSEIVEENITGVVIEKESVDALEKTLNILLKDPLRRKTMGKAARLYAQALFNPETEGQRLEEIYLQVIEEQSC